MITRLSKMIVQMIRENENFSRELRAVVRTAKGSSLQEDALRKHFGRKRIDVFEALNGRIPTHENEFVLYAIGYALDCVNWAEVRIAVEASAYTYKGEKK